MFPSGVYALSAVLYSKLGDVEKCERCIRKLCRLCDCIVSDTSLPDEVLYGRAGYLYALLFVQTHLTPERVPHTIVEQVGVPINVLYWIHSFPPFIFSTSCQNVVNVSVVAKIDIVPDCQLICCNNRYPYCIMKKYCSKGGHIFDIIARAGKWETVFVLISQQK